MALVPSSVLVPSSNALVPSSFLLLLVRHLLLLAWHLFLVASLFLVAMHLFLVASCYYCSRTLGVICCLVCVLASAQLMTMLRNTNNANNHLVRTAGLRAFGVIQQEQTLHLKPKIVMFASSLCCIFSTTSFFPQVPSCLGRSEASRRFSGPEGHLIFVPLLHTTPSLTACDPGSTPWPEKNATRFITCCVHLIASHYK